MFMLTTTIYYTSFTVIACTRYEYFAFTLKLIEDPILFVVSLKQYSWRRFPRQSDSNGFMQKQYTNRVIGNHNIVLPNHSLWYICPQDHNYNWWWNIVDVKRSLFYWIRVHHYCLPIGGMDLLPKTLWPNDLQLWNES